MIRKPFVSSVSPKFISFVILKALTVASVLLRRGALVIVYINELILLSAGEGDHIAFTPPLRGDPSFLIRSICIRGANDCALLGATMQFLPQVSLEILSVFLFSSKLDFGKQQVVMGPRWRSEN